MKRDRTSRFVGRKWWKLLGLAGLAGVAATGAVVARGERRRRAYSPEQVRTRLHERAGKGAQDSPNGRAHPSFVP